MRMKSKTLWLIVGVPGSGKSTFLANQVNKPNTKIISRDAIRFKLLGDGDAYFKNEDTVWNMYVDAIKNSLQENEHTVLDATHLNERSRNKILDRLNLNDVNINVIYFKVPLNVCIDRNAQRTGRAHVPTDVITKMYASYRYPTFNEKYHYNRILLLLHILHYHFLVGSFQLTPILCPLQLLPFFSLLIFLHFCIKSSHIVSYFFISLSSFFGIVIQT